MLFDTSARKNYFTVKIAALSLLALGIAVLYLFYNINFSANTWQYNLHHRSISLIAIVLTGAAIALASVIFQVIVNNRILTPGVLGLDSLFVLTQTAIIFIFGREAFSGIPPIVLFILSSSVMVAFALLLFYLLFQREDYNIFFLLLVGIVFGTLFYNTSVFFEVVMDPSEFQIVQDVQFASFNNVNADILKIAAVILIAVLLYTVKFLPYLNVMALGRDHAVNLGVEYKKISLRMLIIVAVLMSVSTALVGPITFLGILVLNLAIELVRSYRYGIILMAAILISISILLFGQWITLHILKFSTPLSVIINFIGGSYFIYMLLRMNR